MRAATRAVVQPRLDDRLAESEAGRVGDHDVEGVLGAAAVRDRVDERLDHVEVVDERAGVGVGEQQRSRALVRRPHVHEVDRLAVDLGRELRERVDPRLGGAPVERGAPVLDGVARGRSSACRLPVVAGRRLRQPRAREALA